MTADGSVGEATLAGQKPRGCGPGEADEEGGAPEIGDDGGLLPVLGREDWGGRSMLGGRPLGCPPAEGTSRYDPKRPVSARIAR